MIENSKITIAQTATTDSGGMCYAIHLKDDSFVIIDGGQSDIGGANSYKENSEALINHIRSRTNAKKPIISAWFITHFHLDHVDMATRFIEEEKDNFEFKLFAYNNPGEYEKFDESKRKSDFEDAIALHPAAEKRILKTGEKYEFAGLSAEVLMAEDFRYHSDPPSQNHICAALMLTFEFGTKFAVLGDCDTERLYQMRLTDSPVYQPDEKLRCHILQVPHHGLPLGTKPFIDKNLELYKIMEPNICLFPVDEERYTTDKKFFDNPFYSDNYYLLSTRKQNCFHNSKTAVINAKDLTVNFELEN